MEKEELKTDLEALAGGFFITFGIMILVFFLLNYLNILSFSAIYPKTLGFLPHRPFSEKQRAPVIQENSLPIACPVTKEECLRAKVIGFNIPNAKNANIFRYDSLGFPAAKGETVKAVFDGSYTITEHNTIKNIPQRMLVLTRSDGKYDTIYSYIPERSMTGTEEVKYSLPQKVKRGEPLLLALPGTNFSQFGNPDINLEVAVKQKFAGYEIINLQSQDPDNLILP